MYRLLLYTGVGFRSPIDDGDVIVSSPEDARKWIRENKKNSYPWWDWALERGSERLDLELNPFF